MGASYIFAGTAGAGMSLLVIIVTYLRSQGYLKPVTLEHYHIMGKFMLTFTIFWAYIGFDQYMLIWYANIPEETIYFLAAQHGELALLLHPAGRRPLLHSVPDPAHPVDQEASEPALLASPAVVLFDTAWSTCTSSFFPQLQINMGATARFPARVSTILASLLGVGGLVGWLWFRYRVGSANLFPTRDPRLSRPPLKLTN